MHKVGSYLIFGCIASQIANVDLAGEVPVTLAIVHGEDRPLKREENDDLLDFNFKVLLKRH